MSDKHTDKMLALKKAYLIPCLFHFYKDPPVLERGEGCYLFDHNNRRYLDCYSGVGVTNCGHCNPEIINDTIAQLGRLQHTTTIYLTEPMLLLAEALADFIPGECRRSFFCTSGSEANEGALLLSKLATGRSDFIALSRALHGRTYLTAGVTGLDFWRTDPQPPQNVHFAPSPNCLECPFKLQHPDCDLRCAEEVGHILEKQPNRVAAFIAEPIHGNGGIVVPPAGYFKRVKEILDQHAVLLIMDEAQTGFCRTGKRFGFEHHEVQPDIITVCKALGNGLPVSAFVATDSVAEKYTQPGASTFGGNLVCAATALSVLRFMQQRQLERVARSNGDKLTGILKRLQQQFALIKAIRGQGMMLGAELVRENGEPATAEMDIILETLKDKGILVGKTGPNRNVLTLMPPLIMDEHDIEFLDSGLQTAFVENFDPI